MGEHSRHTDYATGFLEFESQRKQYISLIYRVQTGYGVRWIRTFFPGGKQTEV